jgi:hypothetical protein
MRFQQPPFGFGRLDPGGNEISTPDEIYSSACFGGKNTANKSPVWYFAGFTGTFAGKTRRMKSGAEQR